LIHHWQGFQAGDIETLHSYTHAGILQIGRRFDAGYVKSNHVDVDMEMQRRGECWQRHTSADGTFAMPFSSYQNHSFFEPKSGHSSVSHKGRTCPYFSSAKDYRLPD
jgi:hypothetical protein